MSEQIKVVIIDDEQHCVDILVSMLNRHFPDITVVEGCNSVVAAKKAIDAYRPALVFLDVEMPYDNGFELLRQYDHPEFDVIFTTAYESYALKAIKFSALDYLLKPFSIDELSEAVEKYRRKRVHGHPATEDNLKVFLQNLKTPQQGSRKIALPTLNGLFFVSVSDIIRCESLGNYTKVFFQDKTHRTVSKSLKEFEGLLEEMDFFRVHHSHLINMQHLQSYIQGEGGFALMADGTQVEISRRRKADFLKRANQFGP
jgi:two-component system LytT family response regulator